MHEHKPLAAVFTPVRSHTDGAERAEGLLQADPLTVVIAEDSDHAGGELREIERGKGRYNVARVKNLSHPPPVKERHRLLYRLSVIMGIRDDSHQAARLHSLYLLQTVTRRKGEGLLSHKSNGCFSKDRSLPMR